VKLTADSDPGFSLFSRRGVPPFLDRNGPPVFFLKFPNMSTSSGSALRKAARYFFFLTGGVPWRPWSPPFPAGRGTGLLFFLRILRPRPHVSGGATSTRPFFVFVAELEDQATPAQEPSPTLTGTPRAADVPWNFIFEPGWHGSAGSFFFPAAIEDGRSSAPFFWVFEIMARFLPTIGALSLLAPPFRLAIKRRGFSRFL